MRLLRTALPLLLVALGVAVLLRTVAEGIGGGLGLLLGVVLIAAGALRYALGRS